jgi:hypothetical protein
MIQTYFHIIDDDERTTNSSILWTDEAISDEVDRLNSGFNQTPFAFELASITRTFNTTRAFMSTEDYLNRTLLETVADLRVGGPDVMNVFVLEGVCASFKGQATRAGNFYGVFPEGMSSVAERVLICADIIGSEYTTLIHGELLSLRVTAIPVYALTSSSCLITILETGHWLGKFEIYIDTLESMLVLGCSALCWLFFLIGLLHVFEGDSCSKSNLNDFVDDTPQVLNASSKGECKIGIDSCPDMPGLDDVQNYMSYSSCRSHFTSGQIERMYYQFNEYRRMVEPPQPCEGPEIHVDMWYGKYFPKDVKLGGLTDVTADPEGGAILLTPFYYDWELLDLSNKPVNRTLCIERNTLNQVQIITYANESDIIDLNGYVSVNMNGRALTKVTHKQAKGKSYHILFAGDTAGKCKGDMRRFFLDLSFGDGSIFASSPRVVNWRILNGVDVVVDHTATTVRHTGIYTGIFSNSVLYFDQCLPKGSYIFDIENTVGGNVSDSVLFYRLGLDGRVLYEGLAETLNFRVG